MTQLELSIKPNPSPNTSFGTRLSALRLCANGYKADVLEYLCGGPNSRRKHCNSQQSGIV